MTDPTNTAPHRSGPWPWILGAVAGFSVLITLGAPGITSDEPIDTKVGRNYLSLTGGLIEQVGRKGFSSIRSGDLDRLFADNAQHPPLGRWLVGISSVVFEPIEGLLGGSDPLSVHPARVAPMLAFALLVGLITGESIRRFGRAAGIVAGISLVLMPRVFAHAHFASLDTFLALFWTFALISAARGIESNRPTLGLAIAGAAWGLALLTKIHAWLLPPLVFGYALVILPTKKAIIGTACWTVVGLLVFVVGWPWLWNDSVDRLARFLSTSVDRQPLRVLYFGAVLDDVALPWHYAWVFFAVTVPVGLHLLGLIGLGVGVRRRRVDSFPILLAGSVGLFLVLFSTRAPVYDGERLFLLVFPSWAMLAGLGFGTLWQAIGSRRWAKAALVLLVASQGSGVVRMHPYQLSYYNMLVGGLPGAERLGLEVTYWGDALDPTLLAEVERLVPEGESVALAPTVHHLYPPALLTPKLFEKEIRFVPEQEIGRVRWLLVSRRSAYWSDEVRDAIDRGEVVAERSRDGVWLSRLVRLDPPEPAFDPDNREDSFRTN